MLHLSQWPKSVRVFGVKFPVIFTDLGDDQGECRYEPEPGGVVAIKIHQRFRGQDWAWQVLFHELEHAARMVSGASELLDRRAEEAVTVASEAVWQVLVAVAGKRVSERASRGAKGRTPRAKQSNRKPRRRPGRS